jgi:phage terminase small subunit
MSNKTPPDHLSDAAKIWWREVIATYALEDHHVKLLTLAAESWDRSEQARAALAQHGLTFNDRFGTPRARPEIAIERNAKTSFARLLRELDLDVEPPAPSTRPRPLRSNR